MNEGNTLYVTGLSTRVTDRDLEDHFSKEGKVSFFIVPTFWYPLFMLHLKHNISCIIADAFFFLPGCFMLSCGRTPYTYFPWLCICYDGQC